ncbi:MAG TPA: hypothetical protein VKP30_04505 [Polyangiaceae bacterium]|nr:hypothetical protein [Polyangiaceae bacterium]
MANSGVQDGVHLDNIVVLRGLMEFEVNEQDQQMPHSVCEGQPPDEMYFRRGVTIPPSSLGLRSSSDQGANRWSVE